MEWCVPGNSNLSQQCHENHSSWGAFTVNLSWQICVARKRQLQVYNVTDEKMIHVKDIGVPEPALGVAVDGCYICAALLTQYTVYNFDTNVSQQLFSYGCENFLPIIRRITKVCWQSNYN